MPELLPAEPPLSEKPERVLFEGNPALLPSAGAVLLSIVTVGIAVIFYWFRHKSTHYRITTERIVVDSGLFSKRMDQIDLYRINDYVVERPFSQRLLGTGNIVVTAMDKSNPQLRLNGLGADVLALYEALRKATEEEKRRRGVRMIDYE